MKTSKDRASIQSDNKNHSIVIYTLSNCDHCEEAMRYLESRVVEYEHVNIDTASPEERERAAAVFGEDLPTTGMRIAFPIIVMSGGEVITGFDEERIEEAIIKRS